MEEIKIDIDELSNYLKEGIVDGEEYEPRSAYNCPVACYINRNEPPGRYSVGIDMEGKLVSGYQVFPDWTRAFVNKVDRTYRVGKITAEQAFNLLEEVKAEYAAKTSGTETITNVQE